MGALVARQCTGMRLARAQVLAADDGGAGGSHPDAPRLALSPALSKGFVSLRLSAAKELSAVEEEFGNHDRRRGQEERHQAPGADERMPKSPSFT